MYDLRQGLQGVVYQIPFHAENQSPALSQLTMAKARTWQTGQGLYKMYEDPDQENGGLSSIKNP